ncbi:fimbrial protein [Salmonella enterica]|nr:fimbrial protein [Salmonella enterica]EBS0892520.1 fimbrial protein [Salmonella enterica subsp. enterica serovar Abaetetuba]ECE0472905.1 fimbrial protein [Salmonella enterica subsp. enterica serovar Glostrup]ECH8208595.1 fimbrial protein [Salmonella enterica subsp. enterica]EAX7074404.1 hypothetical protein [Salmonella enterica]
MRQKRSLQAKGLVRMALCGLLFSLNADAEQVMINISATGVEPPCSVTDTSGNNQAEVDFESVQVDDVYARTVRKSLPVKVTCEGTASTGKVLKMSLTPVAGGTMPYAGRTVLGTSVTGLGVEVTDKDNNPVPPGTWVSVSGGNVPVGNVDLWAVLVAEKSADLKSGVFTSTASLVMAYQ